MSVCLYSPQQHKPSLKTTTVNSSSFSVLISHDTLKENSINKRWKTIYLSFICFLFKYNHVSAYTEAHEACKCEQNWTDVVVSLTNLLCGHSWRRRRRGRKVWQKIERKKKIQWPRGWICMWCVTGPESVCVFRKEQLQQWLFYTVFYRDSWWQT